MSTFFRLRIAAVLLIVGTAGVASAYDYFFVDTLERQLDAHVDRKVMVVDKLVSIWEYQDVDGHLRFDTEHFRCAIPHTATDSIAYLREVAEKRKQGDVTPPLLALFGEVKRRWGGTRYSSGIGKTPLPVANSAANSASLRALP